MKAITRSLNMICTIAQRLFHSLQVPAQILARVDWYHWGTCYERQLYQEQRGQDTPGQIEPTKRFEKCGNQDANRQGILGPTVRRWNGLSFQKEKKRSSQARQPVY